MERTKVALDSLGCKLNQAEMEFFAWQLTGAGYKLVSVDKADVYILNTCTVTHIADRKCRHQLRWAHRQNPNARLVAIGCYAERSPQELAGIGGVDLVLSNGQKPDLLQYLRKAGYLGQPHSLSATCHYSGSRTRAFIKVQDGCRNFCAYCIVPLVRGEEKSIPIDEVIAEVREQVARGVKEVVLTGTEIGAYRWDGINLGGLLERILAETEVTRLRLSSLQPQEISPELIRLWRNDRLCPHFHLPLQSGSNRVLSRMKRHYTTADYYRAISLIRKIVPEAAITTDVIVGFPGETETEFGESYEFCQQVGFARIHVFPYSPRLGTEAARMPHQVAEKIKGQRAQKMLALAKESAHNFSRQFLGKILRVLWEKKSGGIWSGLTGNYIRVYTRSNQDLTNQLLPVELKELYRDGVWGRIVAGDTD